MTWLIRFSDLGCDDGWCFEKRHIVMAAPEPFRAAVRQWPVNTASPSLRGGAARQSEGGGNWGGRKATYANPDMQVRRKMVAELIFWSGDAVTGPPSTWLSQASPPNEGVQATAYSIRCAPAARRA